MHSQQISKKQIFLYLQCQNLHNKELLQINISDPYIIVTTSVKNSTTFEKIGQTEVIDSNLNPVFKKPIIITPNDKSFQNLNEYGYIEQEEDFSEDEEDDSYKQELKFTIYDKNVAQDRLMGQCQIYLQDLMDNKNHDNQELIQILDKKNQKLKGSFLTIKWKIERTVALLSKEINVTDDYILRQESNNIKCHDKIRICHLNTKQFLHTYQEKFFKDSKNQEVHCSIEFDDNEWFIIDLIQKNPEYTDDEYDQKYQQMDFFQQIRQEIMDGDIIKLTHYLSKKNLHCDSKFVSSRSNQREVSLCSTQGKNCPYDFWKVKIYPQNAYENPEKYQNLMQLEEKEKQEQQYNQNNNKKNQKQQQNIQKPKEKIFLKKGSCFQLLNIKNYDVPLYSQGIRNNISEQNEVTAYVKGESDLSNKGTLHKNKFFQIINSFWQINDLEPFIHTVNSEEQGNYKKEEINQNYINIISSSNNGFINDEKMQPLQKLMQKLEKKRMKNIINQYKTYDKQQKKRLKENQEKYKLKTKQEDSQDDDDDQYQEY